MSKRKIPEPIEKQLISEITIFCEKTGMSEWAFGKKVAQNGKMFSRLQQGKGIWSGTINSIRNYIATYRLPTKN